MMITKHILLSIFKEIIVCLPCLIYNFKQNKVFKVHIAKVHRIYMCYFLKKRKNTEKPVDKCS